MIKMLFKRKKKQEQLHQKKVDQRYRDDYPDDLYQQNQALEPWDFPGNETIQDEPWTDYSSESVEDSPFDDETEKRTLEDDYFQSGELRKDYLVQEQDYLADHHNPTVNRPMEADERYQVYYQDENYNPFDSEHNTMNSVHPSDELQTPRGKRAKYHAKIDRFLTNGIIIVGVLLLAVLLIAFLG